MDSKKLKKGDILLCSEAPNYTFKFIKYLDASFGSSVLVDCYRDFENVTRTILNIDHPSVKIQTKGDKND